MKLTTPRTRVDFDHPITTARFARTSRTRGPIHEPRERIDLFDVLTVLGSVLALVALGVILALTKGPAQ